MPQPNTIRKKSVQEFCSNSCSCLFNNKKRVAEGWVESPEPRRQKSETIRSKRLNAKGKEATAVAKATVTLLDTIEAVIGKTISEEDRLKILPHLTKYDKRRYAIKRNKYEFNFNLGLYPELFDLEKINQIGLYEGGSGTNKLVRDHRVSAAEAIAKKHDPYYISHSVNCELMEFKENHSKMEKSSITYEELVRQVDAFDAKRASSSPK